MYAEFLYSLTEKQARALACQSGVAKWATLGSKQLLDTLAENETAKGIFEKAYGQETSVQG